MDSEIVKMKTQIAVETTVIKRSSDTMYGYYLIRRPPSPGAMPSGYVAVVSLQYQAYHEDINCCIWGWVAYTRPLTAREIDDYELIPDEDNACELYTRYHIEELSVERLEAEGRSIKKRRWHTGPDGKEFVTAQKGLAEKVLLDLNNAAWETNTKTKFSKFVLREIKPAK